MAIIALPTLPTLEMMRLGLTRRLVFFLPRRHAGLPRFECRHDRRTLLPSLTRLIPHSPHLASRAFQERRSRWKFLLRWAVGLAQSTIREFPHPIRLGAFAPQARRNLLPETLCNGHRSASDLQHR